MTEEKDKKKGYAEKPNKTYSKTEAINKTVELLQPIEIEEKQKRSFLLNNAATFISAILFSATIILFQFNRGYSQIYNIPAEAIPLSLERYIPVCAHLLGLSLYFLHYIAETKSEKALRFYRFNLMRVFWGTMAVIWMLAYNGIGKYIGIVYSIMISLFLALFLELILFLRNKPIKEKKILTVKSF